MKANNQTTIPRTLFTFDEHGGMHQANGAAREVSKRFSDPWRLRYSQPPIWVKFDQDAMGYRLEPNLNFHPNLAWDDLQKSVN